MNKEGEKITTEKIKWIAIQNSTGEQYPVTDSAKVGIESHPITRYKYKFVPASDALMSNVKPEVEGFDPDFKPTAAKKAKRGRRKKKDVTDSL